MWRLSILTIAAGVCLVAAVAWTAVAAPGPSRISEPIQVVGSDLPEYAGATRQELWLWAWLGGSWQMRHVQLDERDASSNFVGQEDGILDDNDVVVFMADELGAERPADAWPPGLGSEHPAIEVRVTDPLDPGAEWYAYLFRTLQGPEIALQPLVSFDATSAEIRTDSYTLGFPLATDSVVGIKRLSLYGQTENLLDRLKLRAKVGTFPLVIDVTEEDLAGSGAVPAPDPVIVGPVRIVMDAGGMVTAYASRATLFGGLDDVQLPGGITLSDVRVSLDFSPVAVPATYRDANVPGGVPIDGQPDTVPRAPVPAWREVSFASGRAVLVGKVGPGAAQARVYYKDDGGTDAGDTGDKMSYGDSGVEAPDLAALLATGFPGQIVVLANDASPSAAELVDHLANPLLVTVAGRATGPSPTPEGTGPAPTFTPAPTATPTATPFRLTIPRVEVTGRVVDGSAAAEPPVAGAQVTLGTLFGLPPGSCESPAITNANGEFTIVCTNVLALSPVRISVEAAGYESWQQLYPPWTTLPAEPLLIKLQRGGGSIFLPYLERQRPSTGG